MYTYDPDLEFLGRLKSEDLEDLVHLLIYDKDGTKRISEELSQRQSYKDNCPNHHEYWQDIAGELQCFGANTLATILRGGRGVLYREILCDVCDSIKLEYSKDAATEEIEETMFMKLIGDRVGQMSAEEKEELRRQLNLKLESSSPSREYSGQEEPRPISSRCWRRTSCGKRCSEPGSPSRPIPA